MHLNNMFVCPTCGRDYNKAERTPKIIPSCGHTVCLACLNKIIAKHNQLKCPIDNSICIIQGKNAATLVTNMALMQGLQERAQNMQAAQSYSSQDVCKIHKQPLEFVCLTDRGRICDGCVQSGSHRNHNINYLKNIQNEATIKRKKLETSIREFDMYNKSLDNIFESEKDMLTQVVSDKFETLINHLIQKKHEICSNIENSFESERAKKKQDLDNSIALRWNMEERISTLTKNAINDQFFEALEGEVQLNVKEDTELFRLQTQELRKTLDQALDSLNNSLALQVQRFQQESGGYSMLSVKNLLRCEMKDGRLVISDKEAREKVNASISPEKCKRVRKVTLDLTSEAISGDRIQALVHVWKQLGEINDIKIEFHDDKITDYEFYNFCASGFWLSNDISSLSVNLQGCQVGDESVCRFISEILPKLKRLHHLNLNFNFTKITDETLETFAQFVVPMLRHLDSFQLGLYNTEITDQGLCQLFVRMDNIRTFSLELGNTKITDESIEMFVRHSLLTMRYLESFKLYLYGTEVTDRSIIQIFTNMENVRTFTLELGGTKITDYSIEAFAKHTLSSIKQLENFQLGLYNTNVTDHSVSQLFTDMSFLKTFSLNLGNTKITDLSMKMFAERTLPGMKQVESFQLYLYNTEVSDLSIASMFYDMMPVTTFLLDLDNTKVTDYCIEAFAKCTLPTMKSIENFQLGLYNTGVTDRSIARLFTPMEGVKRYVLDLGQTKVTDKSIDLFMRNTAQSLKDMESFELYLRNTGVTEKNKKAVAQLKERVVVAK